MTTDYILEIQENAPLVISLAFNYNGAEPEPYFYHRLQKLELLTGKKLSKLFIQDQRSYWYTQGADGMGNSLQETLSMIRSICAEHKPPSVTLLGESMGAYGAILLGTMLCADSIIAFAPISFFCTELADEYGDMRYRSKMAEAGARSPSVETDIAHLAKNHLLNGRLALACGTKPPVDHIDAVGIDAMHAWRIKHYYPNQTDLFLYAQASHLVAIYMREQKLLNNFLIDRIAGLA